MFGNGTERPGDGLREQNESGSPMRTIRGGLFEITPAMGREGRSYLGGGISYYGLGIRPGRMVRD